MNNVKKWLAALMTAAMVFANAGVAPWNTVAVFAFGQSYTYTTNVTIPDQVWTGTVPDLSTVDELASIKVEGDLTLVRGRDYTVEASTADKGEAEAIFTTMGAYAGDTIQPVKFMIVEGEAVSGYTSNFDASKYTYDGDVLDADEVAANTIVIKNGNTKLQRGNGKDNYKITVTADSANTTSNGTAGEKYKVVIEVITAVSPEKTVKVVEEDVTIGKKNLAALVNVTGTTAALTYNGKAQQPTFTSVTYKFAETDTQAATLAAADYTISGYENNVNATTSTSKAAALIAASAASKNFTGTTKVDFEIAPAVIDATATNPAYLFVGDTVSVPYTGVAQTPAVNVKAYFENSVAREEIPAADYEIVYPTAVNVGSYDVTIKATDTKNIVVQNSPVATKAFAISQASMKDVTITKLPDDIQVGTNIVTTGNGIKDYYSVKLGDYELVQGTDYDAAYTSTANINKVDKDSTVKLTGKGNFKDDASVTYTAKSTKLADAYVSSASFIYDGTALRPAAAKLGELTVKDNPQIKLSASDYTVTAWSNNTNAGTATATIVGNGTYQDQTSTVEFTISPKTITSNLAVTGIASGSYFVGAEITGASVVMTEGTNKINLSANDCTITAKTVDGGYLTAVTVTGKGNYTGSQDVTVKVESNVASLNNAVITGSIPAGLSAYNQAAIRKYITVTVDGLEVKPDDKNYKVEDIEAATTGKALGTLDSEISFKLVAGENLSGYKNATVKVVQRDIADFAKIQNAITLSQTSYDYSGDENKPDVAISQTSETVCGESVVTPALTANDFTVTYTDNVEVGKATATIAGKGNYKGTTTVEFTITKHALTSADFVVVDPDDSLRQFKAGAAEDLSDKISLKPATGKKYSFDASDYTVKIVPNQKVTSKNDTISYKITINKDSKNYVENATGFDYSYGLIARTASDAEITVEKTALIFKKNATSIADYLSDIGTTTVKVDGATLTKGTDYTVSLEGTNQITSELTTPDQNVVFSFIGNYVGKAKKAFTIVANTDVDFANIKLVAPTGANLVYKVGEAKPVTANYIGTGAEPDSTQYTISYTDENGNALINAPVDAGTYTATVVATAAYGGEAYDSVTYTISKKEVSATEFAKLHEDIEVGMMYYGTFLDYVEYAGKATETPVLDGAFANEFEVISFDNSWDGKDTTKGKATIALKADSNYEYSGSVDKEYEWERTDINIADHYKIADQTYTGKAIEPGVKDVVLLEGSDASLDWVVDVSDYLFNIEVSEKSAYATITVKVPEGQVYEDGEYSQTIHFKIKNDEATAAAANVTDQLNALKGEKAGLEDQAAVEAARKAYDELSAAAKAKVDPSALANLEAAEKAIEAAQAAADQAAADAVINAANALTDASSAEDAAAVVNAYNALTDAQKALVQKDAAAVTALKAASEKSGIPIPGMEKKASKITIKNKAKVKVKRGKAFAVKYTKEGNGKVTVKISGNKKVKKFFKVKGKKIKVAKKAKKGKYKVKVTVSIAATADYTATKKSKTIKVTVK